MYSRNVPGDKAPDRRHRSAHGPQPTAASSSDNGTIGIALNHRSTVTRASQSPNTTFIGTIGKGFPTTKWEGYSQYNQPTDGSRARPVFHQAAHAVRPRSHNSETMTKLARYHGKSIGYCNYSDTLEALEGRR